MSPSAEAKVSAVVVLHHLSLQVLGDVRVFAQQRSARVDPRKATDVATPIHCKIQVRPNKEKPSVDMEAALTERAQPNIQEGEECEAAADVATTMVPAQNAGHGHQATPPCSSSPQGHNGEAPCTEVELRSLSLVPDVRPGPVPASSSEAETQVARRWEPVAIATPCIPRKPPLPKARSKFFSSMLDLIR